MVKKVLRRAEMFSEPFPLSPLTLYPSPIDDWPPKFCTVPVVNIKIDLATSGGSPLVGACLAKGDRIFATGSGTVSKHALRSCAGICLISGHTIHRVLQGAAQRGVQFYFILAVLRTLCSCSEMSLFSLKTRTPVKATP